MSIFYVICHIASKMHQYFSCESYWFFFIFTTIFIEVSHLEIPFSSRNWYFGGRQSNHLFHGEHFVSFFYGCLQKCQDLDETFSYEHQTSMKMIVQ